MKEHAIFVGGEWRTGRGDPIISINPANGEVIAEFPGSAPADAGDAVTAAERALAKTGWPSMPAHERARTLYRIGDLIEDRVDRIAEVQTADTGKCLSETTALARSAAGTFRFYGAALETHEEELTPRRGPELTMSVYTPMGVVAGITPWNSPIASDAQKAAPALAAGNAVLLKPAEWASLTSLTLAEICEEAGLPPGLLSVLPGKGSVVGEAIVRHPQVRKVSFTGGTETGRRIMRAASEKLMPVSLELGGKSPHIVFDDADLEAALAGVSFGIFSSTGQSCIAGSRLFLHRAVFDDFLERLVEHTKALRVGDPRDPATQVAPLITSEHCDQVAGYVDLARSEGAQVLAGGARPQGEAFVGGAYYLPTILTGLDNRARACQEEIFGPILVVLPFEDEDQLVEEANDSVYGLAAGLWTSDYRRAWRVAQRLQVGTVWINTYKKFSISTPFGGMKESGIGREKGRYGIRAYMDQKSLFWGLESEPAPWARLK